MVPMVAKPCAMPIPHSSRYPRRDHSADNVCTASRTSSAMSTAFSAGLGIAQGFATIGTIGFPGRQDYGVIGAVNNLAARLCGEAAAGQILISQRVWGRVEERVAAEPVGELKLKGLHAPVPAFSVTGLKQLVHT